MSYAEENVSAQQPPPRQDARLPCAHGDEERAAGLEKAAREGSQAAHPRPLLRREALPRGAKLRNSGEFRAVYESGRRYDGRLVTAFVSPNLYGEHRLGITASRKVAAQAVARNRAKRLLREAFRLSKPQLAELRATYDWVLNAKRPLLVVKMADALDDFRKILGRVAADERKSARADGGQRDS